MALGWFQHLAGDRAIAWSGGSEPGDEINPAAIAAMAEVGIDITQRVPEALDRGDRPGRRRRRSPWAAATRARSIPGKRYEDWELDDPPARTSTPSARSATRSASACGPSSRASG